ncbi:helix-turn-helix domain-containing protein [Streptomyces sp. NBC_01590]|uniref:PucR family transcriptional regulator n=1 Tax=Streptomyces sp. NBC_01590 TaxID=2975887 RepID=UPI003864FAE8
MPTHEPDRRETGPPLEQILGLIDPGMLDVVVAPRGTGVPVTDVMLLDPGEEREDDGPGREGDGPEPDDRAERLDGTERLDGARAAAGPVLLAVGVEVSSPEALDVLRAADRAGAAAVVLRRGARGPRAALLEAAGRGRTALLTRRPGQEWTEVLGRLRTALAHSAPAGAAGTAGVGALLLGDLSHLANTVADLVGGAITIEDPQSRVLAYSRMDHEPDPMRRLTILGQEVPRWRVVELRESGFFRALWSTEDVVRLPADERYAERLAIAVRHGPEVLGSIWAAADGRPLAADAAAALRTAARAAVPHLSHHQTWGRAAARAREGAVHALLKGNVRSAHEAGVAADRPYAVVVAEAYDVHDMPDGQTGSAVTAGQRVLDVLALQAAAYRPGCVTARSGRRLYVLVPAGDGEADPSRTLLATARSVPRDVVLAGSGPVAAGLSGLPASREAAELVVRVLRERAARLSAGKVVSAVAAYDEVVPETTVLRLLDRVEPLWGSLTGPVHAMVEHDRAHGSAYGDSVAVYLDASCDTGTAARRLNVHPNTLRYRLRRARELFGVDPADPAVRLLAEIGLRLAARRPHGTGRRSGGTDRR